MKAHPLHLPVSRGAGLRASAAATGVLAGVGALPALGAIPALAVLLAVSAAPAGAQAPAIACDVPQVETSFAPVFLSADDGEAIGLDLSVGWCDQRFDTRRRFPRALYRGVGFGGTIPFDDIRIPRNLELSAWAGLSFSLSERTPPDPQAPLDEDRPPYVFDYGVLGLGGHVQYESSEDLDEQAGVAGAQLRWVDPNRPLLPSTVLTLDVVKPTRSDVRDRLGLEQDVHGRAAVHGYWLVPLPGPLELEGVAAWFLTFGLQEVLEDRGWDEGPFLSGELGVTVNRQLGPLVLETLFVGYAWGHRPTAGDETKAWTVGAALGGS